MSNQIEQNTGVVQGDKVLQLLFCLFIADLFIELKCKELDVIFYPVDFVRASHS